MAEETREGHIYLTLLRKLEQERQALGGAVFDVLGKALDGAQLRQLMIEAIRYGDRPEVRARLNRQVEGALDRSRLKELLDDAVTAGAYLTRGVDSGRLSGNSRGHEGGSNYSEFKSGPSGAPFHWCTISRRAPMLVKCHCSIPSEYAGVLGVLLGDSQCPVQLGPIRTKPGTQVSLRLTSWSMNEACALHDLPLN